MKPSPNRAPTSPEAVRRAFLARIGAMALAATLASAPIAVKTKNNAQKSQPTTTESESNDPAMSDFHFKPDTYDPSAILPVAGAEAALREPKMPVAGEAAALASPRLETSTVAEKSEKVPWDGPVLNAEMGLNYGPTGEETFYNLPMDEIVARMHRRGVEGEYWEREDGVKMLGDHVMVAANLDVHPRGSIVETSLGTGMVCDTGGFAEEHPHRLDIATNWEDPRENKTKE